MSDPRDVILRPVVSEKSYALLDQGVYTFVVAPGRQQDRDPPRRRGDLRRQRGQGQHAQPAGQAQAQPQAADLRQAPRHQAGHRHPGRRARPSRSSRGTEMPLRKRKPTSAGRRFQSVSDFAEITKTRPEKSLLAPKPSTGGRNSYGRKTARHRAAATSSSTASSTSSGPRTASRPPWPPSSTTPTATPASPCSTTTTARSATSWPRPG